MAYTEKALMVGGPYDGREIDTYPGQGTVKVPRVEAFESPALSGDPNAPIKVEQYKLHRVHDSRGFHRLIGLLEGDARGPMQALYEGYGKVGVR